MKSKSKKLNLSKYQVAKINSINGGNGTDQSSVTKTKNNQVTTSKPTTPPTVLSTDPACN